MALLAPSPTSSRVHGVSQRQVLPCQSPYITSSLSSEQPNPSLLGTGACGAALTGDAGDAQDMGIADGELVHHGAWLVGIDDHHLAGGQGAGEDPHPA